MEKVTKIYIVLPAYNEAENLPYLLEALETVSANLEESGYVRHYVVVDDGSDDPTPNILKKYQAELPMDMIRHGSNEGLGPTLRDGLFRAVELADPDDIAR